MSEESSALDCERKPADCRRRLLEPHRDRDNR